MGVGRAALGHERENLVFVELDRLARREVVRRDDHRPGRVDPRALHAAEHVHQPLGHVLDVRRAPLHIGVVHRGKHLREVIRRHADGVFRVHPLGGDDVGDRIAVVKVLEHHLVDLEDHRVGLPHLDERLLVERLELFDGLCLRVLEPGDLRLRVVDAASVDVLLAALIERQPAERDPAEHALAV